MKRWIVYSLSLLLLAAGCTDPTTGTTTVSGQVVENQSRKPVPKVTGPACRFIAYKSL